MRGGLWSVIKFILAVLMVPVVIGLTAAFLKELEGMGRLFDWFQAGVLVYTVCHLFVWTPRKLYDLGQHVLTEIFNFSAELIDVLPKIVPFGTVLLLLLLYILKAFVTMTQLEPFIVAGVGFSFALHVIMTAQLLGEDGDDLLRGHYFWIMVLSYSVSLLIVAGLVALNFPHFSFPSFFQDSLDRVQKLYHLCWTRLV